MPAIPVKAGGNPCAEHECALCCYETEMPLTESDIVRLEGKGYARDFFMAEEGGYPVLKNRAATAPREGHHCVFLVDDKCSVYADRPEGCRWYPVVITPERRAVRDEECPHRMEFRMPPDSQRQLQKLLNQIDRDTQKRNRAA